MIPFEIALMQPGQYCRTVDQPGEQFFSLFPACTLTGLFAVGVAYLCGIGRQREDCDRQWAQGDLAWIFIDQLPGQHGAAELDDFGLPKWATDLAKCVGRTLKHVPERNDRTDDKAFAFDCLDQRIAGGRIVAVRQRRALHIVGCHDIRDQAECRQQQQAID